MKHDELVKRLRSGCDSNTAFLLCYKAADALVALQTELAAARALLMNCRHILNAYDKAYGRGENFQRYDLPLLLSGIDAALAAPEEKT